MANIKETLLVRGFGLTKIPLILLVGPSVLEVNERRVVIKIPLTRLTRNHLKCMYFGALCVGADLAGGYLVFRQIRERRVPVSLIFKDFHADFSKRAEEDVHFTCEDGQSSLALLEKTLASGNREEMPVHVTATTPALTGDEPIAKFQLTLSIKKKDR